MTTTLPNRIIKYFVDTSNPSQSGFYFYEKAGTGGFVRLGALADASRAGDNTFEIDSSTAENVIYNGLGGADTYVVRSNLDKNIEISDPHTGDDGSGNEAKNTIVFDSDVTVTSINQVTRLEEADILRIELTLDTGAVITVNGPDVFQYVVGGATALDFAGFIATYGASGITPANRAPVIENVSTDLSIDENVDGSAAPVSVGRVAASDADASDTLTYSIVNAVDQNGGSVTGFEVDGAGLITYVGTGLDAETITSVALTVSASDGEESAQTSVAISVTNIDEGNARFVVTSDGDITAAAVGDVLTVRTISADPDGNDAFTYQWYRDGAEIADATEASYTIPEDYNRNSIYVVVRYTDGSGTNEVVTLSGILAPVPEDNADSSTTATPAVLNLADLTPATGFRLIGDKFASAVSSVGDINGDGYDDFAIGAPRAESNGEDSGATYVVFGKASGFSRTIELSELDGSDGFRIDGESAGDLSGFSVSASDFNGDGYDDIIIGAHQADPNGVKNSGSTYIVFGKESGFSGTIDLSNIVRSGSGVRIDGEKGYYSGNSVSAGDVNGDGYDDIIIGAPGANFNNTASGSAYVVFGKADGSNGLNGTIELSELDGSDGFRIDGDLQNFWIGWSVSAGDVNGDGYDDVIIGSPFEKPSADPNGDYSGSTYVIFGKESGFSGTMDLSELDGSDGFRIDGENRYHFSGDSVSAGDINNDGYDDIIIGADGADPNGHNSGATYVVFGKESGFSRTMDLSELDGSDGFRINGENAGDYSGDSVSSAGDFNGDGYDDIIIGADEADSNGERSGSTYVVFGKESGFSRVIELSELDGSDGFRIDGENTGERSGYFVSSAGDINNDGYDDIIIETLPTDDDVAGYSYVIYGHATSVTDSEEDTAAPANIIVKYFVDTSNPSESGFYFYEVAGEDNLVRLGRASESTLGGDDTFEINSPTAELVIYNGFGGADTYVIRGSLDNDVQIHDIDFGDDGSGNEVKNTIVFASDVTVTSIHQDRLQGRADVIKIEQTLDTDAVVTVHVPDAFEYVVGGAAALDFAEFIATYGASGISATNRAPVFENEPTDLSINENADGSAVPVSVGRVVASDADAGDTLTYSIVSTADQNGDSVTGFEVDGTGLITYVGTGLDAETITSVALTVSASDGQDSAQTSVAISVADLNDVAPTITSGATGNALTENATVPNTQVIYTATGTSDVTDISWSLSGPDAGLFNINPATGEVRFDTETTPDAETKGSYDFMVVATSGALAAVEQAVAIAVTNVDEGNASFVVTSNRDLNVAVAGDVLTVGLRSSDPDGDGTLTYQWYRDGVDIAGATGASYTITEADGGNSLYVAVRYTDGSGTDETVTASGIIVSAPVDNTDRNTPATPPAILNLADLTPTTGFRLDGENAWDYSGRAVSSAGDVNGDGYDDIIIGVKGADPNGPQSGSSYVVFGKASGFSRAIEFSELDGSDGFRLDGEDRGDWSGYSVSSAGDVNGDGYDDIIIGAHYASQGGASYVVFGKESSFSRAIELSELDGSDGFRIGGENTGDKSGYSVSSAGDVNGDGYDDIIIGAVGADFNGRSSGSSYIVFGKEGNFGRTIELSELDGRGGFRIDGENAYDKSGYSVSSAGDINGDGYDDIIIGAHYVDWYGDTISASSYVVFGKESDFNRTIELSELDGSDGFRIDGENTDDKIGKSVSSAGDINGDGYDDIIIGAYGADPNGSSSGSSYVVFGKESSFSRAIELSELDGSDGFRIDGTSAHYLSGYSVSSAGDVNGDGYDDVIIGAYAADPNGVQNSGASYVVFGKASGFNATINLSASSGGIRIDGANVSDWSGYSVSSAGDVNGDGYDDVIIGAALADPNGKKSGANYVVFGYATSDADEDADTVIPAPAPANRAPVFENEPTDLSIDENADGSAAPVSVGRVVASDADAADTLTYSIVTADQNGGSVTGFEVDGAGLITYAGTGLDAETITSVALTVSASDGEDSAQTSVAISVTNIDEGNASFVVTSDGDLTAAVAGDVLTVGLRSSDPDGDGTFTYQWYRDGVDIAGATGASYTIPEDYDGNSIYVVVRYTDGSGADETITASGIIVPVLADNDDDASEDPVNTTYTMTQAPTGVSLTRGGVALSVGETFTHQDIQGGSVALTVNDENALSGLRLTTDDGTDANPAEISLDIEVREVADIAAPEAGNDLDYSENEGSLVIDTGDYGDQITAAQGSDFITGGLGDDTINLDPIEGRETGQDTVVYNFGSGSIFTATDGGDDITGFKRGEDIFLLKTESDNPELATLDGLLSYVSGPDKGSSHDDVMIVTPNYVFGPEDGGNNIVVTGITGITLHFEDAGTYGGGYLAQGHVSITFDEQLDWAEFLSLIEIDNGDGTVDENFNYGRGLIRDLSALPNLMGEGSLAYEVEAPAQTPPQDVDVPLEDDIPATSFDVV